MSREVIQRSLIAAELLFLALPTTAICMFFSMALLSTVGFPWDLEALLIMHFVLLGNVGMVGLWAVAITYLRHRGPGLKGLWWWWRAACLGAGLASVSLLLLGLPMTGWEAPEGVVIVATGSLASPLLVPFLHLAYLRRRAYRRNATGLA
ncbi:hypothetical protein SAMN05192555_10858 [Franzmannia pantelleriensis]|uniref:Uncharacterized protein n=1 Tax=Franzmannia pantelleriensis TaxID=48727 RepID=A0A1G9PD19_9GAMM|nr:hypothetical protein [Halomonas pantelleriensis]SDL96391.1 hypothetical protein SAMN05192555_10858 [Halomonas pantelleriensis]